MPQITFQIKNMSKKKNLSSNDRRQIQLLRNEGLTLKEIAARLNFSINACHQALKHIQKYQITENVIRAKKARKTTPRVDRMIHRISEADRHKTAVDVHKEIMPQLNSPISTRTVQRRLNEFGLNGRVARKKPRLSKKNIKDRLAFAKEHVKWTREQWSKVLFTDESKFNRFGSDGNSYVRRRIGEEFSPKCVKLTTKGGGGSVCVWGGMTINGTGPIHRINGIMDQHVYVDILDSVVIPFTREKLAPDWIFQADNDPKHTSKRAKEFLRTNNVNVMKWPSQSPDLNPIEMLWIDIDKAIKEKKPTNIDNLYAAIQNAWNNISMDRCIRLIESMPRRCQEVIRNKGLHIKY